MGITQNRNFAHNSRDKLTELCIYRFYNICSASYNTNYHIVWCPKFRKLILADKVKTFVEEQLETIAETKGYKILESRVMSDHIHLFIEANPLNSATNIVKILKGVTGLRLFKFAEAIERYIREQQTEWNRLRKRGQTA